MALVYDPYLSDIELSQSSCKLDAYSTNVNKVLRTIFTINQELLYLNCCKKKFKTKKLKKIKYSGIMNTQALLCHLSLAVILFHCSNHRVLCCAPTNIL